jgi:hypothetical protein
MSKTQLLQLMKVKDHAAAPMAVIHSGLLPVPQLQQFLNGIAERAISRMRGKSGIPEWETWATDWLSGADRSPKKAVSAERAAWAAYDAWGATAKAQATASAQAAAHAARVAAWTVKWTAEWTARAERAAIQSAIYAAIQAAIYALEAEAEQEEIEAQYQDLLELVNAL